MASPVNTNIMNASALTQNNLRRRSIRVATELIAKSAVNLVDIPGLKESVQAARGIVGALKRKSKEVYVDDGPMLDPLNSKHV
ncbi:unnamed protein product [Rhizoctonia solani]|uniref:Uncharacterized protein n=1 Tax=Rhizoctonia solani TaxID=456999 RepID=A0A8H3C2Q8_9AGAM|nr:unnamed protein product [Rhizoctonia solani]CAE6470258.1 unnamed protein product [Rhizoctonia solani]